MVVIVNNGGEYSDGVIHFVDVPEGVWCDEVKAVLLGAVESFHDGSAHVIAVVDGGNWEANPEANIGLVDIADLLIDRVSFWDDSLPLWPQRAVDLLGPPIRQRHAANPKDRNAADAVKFLDRHGRA